MSQIHRHITEAVADFTQERFPKCRRYFVRNAVSYMAASFSASGTRTDAENLLLEFHALLCRDVFFTTGIQQAIESWANKRFPFGGVHLDANNYVLDQMAKEQYARLRKYNGSASKKGFIRRVTARLLEDYSRKRYGYCRPPKFVENMGKTWVRVFKLVCLERRSAEEVETMLLPVSQSAIDINGRKVILTTQNEQAAGDSQTDLSTTVSRAAIRNAIKTIRAKVPNCGELSPRTLEDLATAPERDEFGEDTYEPASGESSDEMVSELLSFVADLNLPGGVSELVMDLRALRLNDDDLMILRQVYLQGESAVSVARTLEIKPAKIYPRIRSILSQIETVFKRHQLTLNENGQLVFEHE